MSAEILKKISGKYEHHFGQTALAMGFISEAQLEEALHCQAEEDHTGQRHRLLGAILFEKDWMSGDQIDLVLNSLLKGMRENTEEK